MSFQSTVNVLQGFGVPGELLLDGPTRAERLTINSNGATPNVYGYAATKSASTNVAVMGGAIAAATPFAGIMAAPKEAQLQGTSAGGTLAPTLAIPDNSDADFVTMGTLVAQLGNACNIGDLVTYNLTTGALGSVSSGSAAPSGSAIVPNAVVYRYPVTNAGGGLTAIRLTN